MMTCVMLKMLESKVGNSEWNVKCQSVNFLQRVPSEVK
jgi:hypothetical protein